MPSPAKEISATSFAAPDKFLVLWLTRQAATYRRLAEITSSETLRPDLLARMAAFQGQLDAAVFAAMRRAS